MVSKEDHVYDGRRVLDRCQMDVFQSGEYVTEAALSICKVSAGRILSWQGRHALLTSINALLIKITQGALRTMPICEVRTV